MKYLFSLLFIGFLISCGTDPIDIPTPIVDPVQQLATDKQLIKDYLSTNNIEAEETESGLHYTVETMGDGAIIESTSVINALFRGYLLDGTTFSETNECSPQTLTLSTIIPGFQEGVQKFQVGGKGTLYIPSGLAFGSQSSQTIPANSVVAFDIEIVDQKEFDRAKIKEYLAANNIEADSTESGIFYKIDEPGTGDHPTSTSNVTVNYKGFFTDGTVFDESSSSVTFGLNAVIQGWQEAVPLLKKGGSGTFLIPSDLAYGPSGTPNGSILGNTMLIFEIELVNF